MDTGTPPRGASAPMDVDAAHPPSPHTPTTRPPQATPPRTPSRTQTPTFRPPPPPPADDVVLVDDRDDKEKEQAVAADKIVLEYLRKRGYKRAEQAMLRHDLGSFGVNAALVEGVDFAAKEADVDDDLRNVVMMLQRPGELADSDARRYEESYCELRDWVDGSLDIYKTEMHTVLYPMLVHCFLEMVRRDRWKEARIFLLRCGSEFRDGASADGLTGRSEEILSLLGIASPQHLEENATAKLFLENRYEIHLSSYAFELIVSFLADDARRVVLLRILNQRCRVRLDAGVDGSSQSPGVGSQGDNDTGKQGFVPAEEKKALLKTDILWGRLRPELYMIPDEEVVSAGKPGATTKGKGKNASVDKAKVGGDIKAKPEVSKKDAAAGDEDEEPITRKDGRITESRIPLKKYRFGAPGLETLVDRKNRANLEGAGSTEGALMDLSILCYTFTNTKGDGLNCSAVSEDGSQVAAGMGDSTVRIWDARGSGTSGSEGLSGRSARLVGHSGPVYSVEWTACGRFILSGSEDGTVRLWNSVLKTDIVAYRGHNFPVWSVSLAPLGHYFASGSHDRTARIWSTDHVMPLRILAGHLADVDCVQWHPNCNYVATGSSDRTARLWDVRDGKCARVFGGQNGTVHSLAFSPDGKTLACGGDGRYIEVWDVRMGARVKRLEGHRSTVWSLAYSREGGVLASGGADHAVCVWDASEWSSVIDFEEEVAMLTNGGNAHVNANVNANVNAIAMAGGSKGEGDGVTGNGAAEQGLNESGRGGDGAANGRVEGTESAAARTGTGEKTGTAENKEAKEEQQEGQEQKREQHEQLQQQLHETKRKKLADIKKGNEAKRKGGSALLERFETKQTPIHRVQFTKRNLLIATGSFGS